jgi:hypothetical protein
LCNLNQIEIQIEILMTFESQMNKYERELPLCKCLNQIVILMRLGHPLYNYLNQIAILMLELLLYKYLNQMIQMRFGSQRNKYEQGLPLCNYYQIAIQMLFESQRQGRLCKYLNQIAILM